MTYLCEAVERRADMSIHLCSIKVDIRDLQKCKTVLLFSLNFVLFYKIYFSQKVICINMY